LRKLFLGSLPCLFFKVDSNLGSPGQVEGFYVLCTFGLVQKYLNINMGGGYKSSLHRFSAKLRFEVFWLSEQCLCSLFLLLVAPGYYNTIQVLEAIALHLDSVNGKLASGRTLYRASFVFFLTRLLTMRIAYHVLMPKEIKHWKLSVNFLHSFLSDLQENHGRSDADGGCTIISVKTPMQQKPWQVTASFLKGPPSLNVWADVYFKLIYLDIWFTQDFCCPKLSI